MSFCVCVRRCVCAGACLCVDAGLCVCWYVKVVCVFLLTARQCVRRGEVFFCGPFQEPDEGSGLLTEAQMDVEKNIMTLSVCFLID